MRPIGSPIFFEIGAAWYCKLGRPLRRPISGTVAIVRQGESSARNRFETKGNAQLRFAGVVHAGVRSVWLRHNLQTFRLRLAALERKAAEDGLLLTKVQVAALEHQFYQVAFRKKIYTTMEELQADLDGWINATTMSARTRQDVLWMDADGDVRRRQTNLSGEGDIA
jgi:hypothetical protein